MITIFVLLLHLEKLNYKINSKEKNMAIKNIENLVFNKSIMRWDEALPLGNGLIGCLVWGNGNPLRFSLDRGDLWDTRPAKETLDKDFNYKKLIELVKEKNQKQIEDKFDFCYNNPTPTKIPAGRIEINFKEHKVIENRLNFNLALAEFFLTSGNESYKIKTYLHAVKKIGWIRVEGNDIPEVSIIAPRFHGNSNSSIEKLAYPEKEEYEQKGLKWFVQKTAENLEYGIFVGERNNGIIRDIVYYVASSKDGENWIENTKNLITEVLNDGYEEVIRSHEHWWENFWSKSSINIPDKLFEKHWYIANYLFGSCSRKGCPPMPLQGVWTADEGQLPPWKGDYHNDLNTQMSYMHYLKANHIDEGESFIDFLWNLVPEAREFARTFYDAPGLCLPAVMTIEGKPLGGWPMYSLSLTNQIWLCQSFDLHYRYTGDEKFLEKAYSYLKETALCIMRWLEPDKYGKLKLPISSSPEIHDNSMESWLKPNSNYDLALIIYLFKTLLEYSKILENEEISLWEKMLVSMDDIYINEKNVLMLNSEQSLMVSHRHHSHAMAIHPLRLMDYIANKDTIDATVENLESLGTGQWVGFSFTWMSELYAIQGNGEGAAYQLKLFWENLCSPNGFHLNGDYKKRGLTSFHYRPFTLESNMCAADALQEMLLQNHNHIQVFPAIPQQWREEGVSFENLRAWKGLLVSSEIKDENLSYIKLSASKAGEYSIINNFNSHSLIAQFDHRKEILNCKIGETFTLNMLAGEVCWIASKECL
jgi:alpha-L-fucosidase 2